MTYVLTDDNNIVIKYPYSVNNLRSDNPSTSFPIEPSAEQLAEFNVFEVVVTPQPAFDEATQNCVENASPQFVDNVWVSEWKIEDKTEEEILQYQLQMQERNKYIAKQLLTNTDWAAVSSVSDPAQSTPYLVNQQEFFQYRNQLRIIMLNPPGSTVSWPTPPEAVWSV